MDYSVFIGRYWHFFYHGSVYIEWLISLIRPIIFMLVLRTLLILMWRKRRSPINVLGIVAFAVGLLFLSQWISHKGFDHNEKTPDFTLLEFNCNFANTETSRFIAAVQEQKPDVIVLIEPNPIWFQQASQALSVPYPYTFYVTGIEPFTLAVLSRMPLIRPQSLELPKTGLSVLSTRFALAEGEVQLLATHVFPPISQQGFEQRNHELAEMAQLVKNTAGSVIFAGDINTTPLSNDFTKFILQSGLSEASQHSGVYGSWPSSVIYNIAIRHWGLKPVPYWLTRLTEWLANLPLMRVSIDHVLAKGDIIPIHSQTLKEMGSDHLAIQVGFQWHRTTVEK